VGSCPKEIIADDIWVTAEGILNYHGSNTLAISLWALDTTGGRVADIALKVTKKVKSSKPSVKNMYLGGWKPRHGAY
jgi:hypothetical protein